MRLRGGVDMIDSAIEKEAVSHHVCSPIYLFTKWLVKVWRVLVVVHPPPPHPGFPAVLCACGFKQVNLVGVSLSLPPWLVVIEIMQYGDLRKVLQVWSHLSLHA